MNALRSVTRRTWLLAAALAATIPFAIPGRSLTAELSETVELKDMTWVEVRAALAAGYTSAIIPTGGIEQNGPHMILGKHDYLVTHAARTIAKGAGRTLVAPVVSYVPEGAYNPPTGHMRFPGTLGVPETVFAGVLEGIARSLKVAGFKTIFIIGDHGQSQPVQAEVARKLTDEWKAAGVRVVQVGEYYAVNAQTTALEKQGFDRKAIGQHASVIDTSELLSVHPKGVDLARYSRAAGSSEPSGVYGNPSRSSAELGLSLLSMRMEASIARIVSERR